MSAVTTLPNGAANHWADAKCAKAFWSQSELPVFHALTADTLAAAYPNASAATGRRVLDLGCGGGTLTRGLWERSGGTVGGILGVDYAAANAQRYDKLAAELNAGDRIRFEVVNFSRGLPTLADATFDCVVSGLSITYAEYYDEAERRWTQQAYDGLFHEVFRVLKPGGRFAFSVNVPNPSWWTVGLKSFFGALRASPKPLRLLKNLNRMNRYGRWLKQEADKGRFHYLPADEVTAKLAAAGFAGIGRQLGYAGQAFVFHADKPDAEAA